MARHVISINDTSSHEESPECRCSMQVVSGKDGELIYVHEDLSDGSKKSGNFELKTMKLNEIEIEFMRLRDLHDKLLSSVVDNPTMFQAEVIHHVNNGILTRLDYLLKKRYIIEEMKT